MINLFKKIFGKKEVTKEDKVVNLIAKFIKNNYQLKENTEMHANTNTIVYYTSDIQPPAVFYYEDKELVYNRKLAREIYDYIPDDRLLQPDSKLMGEVFEKLYERKVKSTTGYIHVLE
jgi:hypothetical protein